MRYSRPGQLLITELWGRAGHGELSHWLQKTQALAGLGPGKEPSLPMPQLALPPPATEAQAQYPLASLRSILSRGLVRMCSPFGSLKLANQACQGGKLYRLQGPREGRLT